VTRYGLSHAAIKSVWVPLPSIPEQAAIVRFLDHVDRRIRRYIRAKQKLIKLLEEQKQAIIHRAVTRGLDPNVRLKPSGVEWLGDVPGHWEVHPAKYFYREVDDRSETGTEELLSVSHITGVTPRSQKNITMFMAISYVGHKVCKPGDLVINTMWAWMAALGVARQTGIVSPSYGVYRPLRPTTLLGAYADLLLRTKPYVSEYVCRSTGIRSSRLRLYPEQFLRIRIVCPPANEQRTMLERLSAETADTEKAIAGAQREISLLREYRTRLIADVVTGKVDVRESAARLPEEAREPQPPEDIEAAEHAEEFMDAREPGDDNVEAEA
jgi:type I restriction enzyme S subunit